MSFDNIVSMLALPTGPQRFCLIPALMEHDAQKKWMDIVTNYTKENTQKELEECVEKFLLLFMEEDISLGIKEWLSEIKKPRSMPIQDFVQRINHLKSFRSDLILVVVKLAGRNFFFLRQAGTFYFLWIPALLLVGIVFHKRT
jgi:hypothetical protein